MENVERRYVDVFGADTLTWAEYNLEYFAKAILERATSIVQPKEAVSDFDKAIWFTSLTVLLGKILPPNRFLFRIVEDQDKFFIQFHDTAKLQQPQTVEVPYRKIFDWKIDSWKDAIAIPTAEERRKLYDYWVENGQRPSEIMKRFHISEGSLYHWRSRSSTAYSDKYKCWQENSYAGQIRRVAILLYESGIKFIDPTVMCTIFDCSRPLAEYSIKSLKSSDTAEISKIDLDHAIKYIELLMSNAELYLNQKRTKSITNVGRAACNSICKASGIRITSRSIWDRDAKKSVSGFDSKNYNKIVSYLNGVMTTLKQRKEGMK